MCVCVCVRLWVSLGGLTSWYILVQLHLGKNDPRRRRLPFRRKPPEAGNDIKTTAGLWDSPHTDRSTLGGAGVS